MSATSEPTQPVRTRPSGIATHGKSLKRYFIGPFIMLNGAGMIYSIVRCAISRPATHIRRPRGRSRPAPTRPCSPSAPGRGRGATAA